MLCGSFWHKSAGRGIRGPATAQRPPPRRESVARRARGKVGFVRLRATPTEVPAMAALWYFSLAQETFARVKTAVDFEPTIDTTRTTRSDYVSG